MARREVVMLEDDLDGGAAAETIQFGVDGTYYEIDLNSKNAKKLRDALGGYVAAARKVGRGPARRTRRALAGSGVDRDQNRIIREWAVKAGRQVAGRGRIPADIIAEYRVRAGRKAR